MKTFDELLASKSDAELGAMVRDRYARLSEAKDMGLCDHPVHQWNADNKVLRAHRVAKDAAGSGLGARELEENDQPGAQDDPPPTLGTPRPPVREGDSLAAHDAAIAVDGVIPGLSRIRGPYTHHDTRVVDEDGIVQPRGRK